MCINYRTESFEKDLIRETEGFVEVYFGGFLSEKQVEWKTNGSR